MECAGRALSFWAYQTTQEIVYQKYLEKTLTDKYKALDLHLDKTVNEANAEIENLQSQMKDLALQNDSVRRKYEELGQAYKEKSRKLLQTQELYDRVKRKAEMGQMQAAACDAVDSHLQMHALPENHEKGALDQSFYEQQEELTRQHKSRGLNGSELLAPQNRGTPNFADNDELWARQVMPSRIDMHKASMITPIRQRSRNTTRVGLSTIPGLVAGTPVPLNGPTRMQEFTIAEHSEVMGSREFGVGISSINANQSHHAVGGNATPLPHERSAVEDDLALEFNLAETLQRPLRGWTKTPQSPRLHHVVAGNPSGSASTPSCIDKSKLGKQWEPLQSHPVHLQAVHRPAVLPSADACSGGICAVDKSLEDQQEQRPDLSGQKDQTLQAVAEEAESLKRQLVEVMRLREREREQEKYLREKEVEREKRLHKEQLDRERQLNAQRLMKMAQLHDEMILQASRQHENEISKAVGQVTRKFEMEQQALRAQDLLSAEAYRKMWSMELELRTQEVRKLAAVRKDLAAAKRLLRTSTFANHGDVF
ncbi:hypothetical protein ACHAQH_002923 [Verticillium albo-atrum]